MLLAVALVLSLAATIEVAEARAPRPGKHSIKKRKLAATALDPREQPKRKRTVVDRSIGAPWSGQLQAPAQLSPGKRYFLRRPWRTFGTRSTIDFVATAVKDTLAAFPKAHALAIGDFSQQSGGYISEHRSHQSGRDVDLGLFYKQKPKGYPETFVSATPKTLDPAATWRLVSSLAKTADEDGGVQMIFFDQTLQAVLVAWADSHGVSEARITAVKRVFRHIPNHTNHLHVRFKCRERDTSCQ